jgi:ATP-binding cassette subfamily B protein
MVGKRFRRVQETYSAMSDHVQETFTGSRVVKSFVKETWFIKKFADTNEDYKKANMSLVVIHGFFFPLTSFLSGVTTLLVLYIGGERVITGVMSPGSLVALLSYLQMLIWPIMGAGFTVNMVQRGAVSLKRVNEIMRTIPEIRNNEEEIINNGGGSLPLAPALRASTTPSTGGTPVTPPYEISLINLSFAYPGNGPAIQDINVTVPRGEWLGVMGRTGAGKSTLWKTLPRLVNAPAGTVQIRGEDVRNWPLAELRGLFGAAPQDSFLFSDTIRNNIRYGKDDATDEEIEAAAHTAALDRDLAPSPTPSQGEGRGLTLDTLIGERGLTLSGGQKQRVAIARAVLTDPEILILDDSLSACDAETEKLILHNLAAVRHGKSTVIISHRAAAVRLADHIMVLDDGRVSEYGALQELLAANGWFARIVKLQSLDG